MNFSQDIIDEVKLRNDIIDVISEYVKLDRKGSNHMGLCPFHNEKTPSFSVSSQKQFFYCFGCQKGGNVITFISLAEGLDYTNSIKFLADRAGIELPESNDQDEIKKKLIRQSIIEANTVAAKYFFANLSKSKIAMEYLEKRGISEKTIRRFGIGYSEPGWSNLYEHLRQKGFSDDILLKSGLIIKSGKGGMYDRFRNRVMFPIFDVMGKVIGFGGRVLDDSLPKYLNSPETSVYSKGKNLYALNFARKYKNRQLIIVEGYMDVITLHQYGITNAVASLGTALTDSQGRLLKKYCEEVIISYDADGAGQKAALKSLDILNRIGCNVKVLSIPDGKDPDDYVKKNGPDGFNRLVNKAMTLVDYKVSILKKNINTDTTEGSIRFLKELSVILANMENLVEREIYINKYAKQYSISEEALNAEVDKHSNKSYKKRPVSRTIINRQKPNEILSEELEKISHDEKMILALVCIDNDVYSKIKNTLNVDFFQFKKHKILAGKIFNLIESKTEVTIDKLFDMVDADEHSEYAKIIHNECNCEDNLKAITDLIKRIEFIRLSLRQQEIIERLSDSSITEKEKQTLNEELKDIIMRKRLN